MGYDKPDLGFVVRYQAPSSVTSYYRAWGGAEAGAFQPRRDFAVSDRL